MSIVIKNISGTAIVAAAALTVGLGSAGAAVLEEFVTTAKKREESLTDVPMSIIGVSGDSMREQNISTLEGLSPQVPNFTFAQAVSGSDNMFIRGIGSGINFGFEQAVGQFVDGIYYGRSRFGRGIFLDIERAEILRGPQGAILGKNTTAGAINITTANPTDEFEAWITPTYEFDGEEGWTVEGALSGPLTDNFKARFALRYDDRDGYVKNVVTGNDDQSREDVTARLKLLWEINDRVDATFMYQWGDYERTGRTSQLSLCGQPLRGMPFFPAMVANGEDCEANFSRNVVNARNGMPTPESNDVEFNVAQLTLNWSIGDLLLTSLTGYADYDANDLSTVDFTFIEIASFSAPEEHKQFTQEFRITSPTDQALSYIGGIFFQGTDLDVTFTRNFPALPPPLTPSSNLILTSQEATTIAPFGEIAWNINEQWTLTVGARYTYEEKEASQSQSPTALYTTMPINLVPPAGPSASAHSIPKQKRTENDFSPQADIQWRPTNDSMYYFSLRQGFKGGGFDFQLDCPENNAGRDCNDDFEFEDEKVLAAELGTKLTLLDGSMQLNAALFWMQYDDLQVSTIDSFTTTFNVGNAAEATSQGLEVEWSWAPLDTLTLVANVAYLDATYDDFPGAPCNTSQVLSMTCPTPPPESTQNLAGRELPYSPEYSGAFSAEFTWPLGSNVELVAFGRAAFKDDFFLILDLDPNLKQDSYWLLDARLGVAAQNGKWNVMLIGRNLGDELTRSFGNDGLGGPFMTGSYFSFVDPPRSLALQGTLRF